MKNTTFIIREGLGQKPPNQETYKQHSSIKIQGSICFLRSTISSPLFASLDHLPGCLLPLSDQTHPKHEVNEPGGWVEFQAKLTG